MRVIHRLVGYDQKTDRAKVSFKVAGRLLSNAKRIAKVPNDDPQAVWSYPLSPDQVSELAKLIGARLDPAEVEYFLEAFADSTPKGRAA
jgi:hypothetical protein